MALNTTALTIRQLAKIVLPGPVSFGSQILTITAGYHFNIYSISRC